jgi:hypothetical protein
LELIIFQETARNEAGNLPGLVVLRKGTYKNTEGETVPELVWMSWRGQKLLALVKNLTTVSRTSIPYLSH